MTTFSSVSIIGRIQLARLALLSLLLLYTSLRATAQTTHDPLRHRANGRNKGAETGSDWSVILTVSR